MAEKATQTFNPSTIRKHPTQGNLFKHDKMLTWPILQYSPFSIWELTNMHWPDVASAELSLLPWAIDSHVMMLGLCSHAVGIELPSGCDRDAVIHSGKTKLNKQILTIP